MRGNRANCNNVRNISLIYVKIISINHKKLYSMLICINTGKEEDENELIDRVY